MLKPVVRLMAGLLTAGIGLSCAPAGGPGTGNPAPEAFPTVSASEGMRLTVDGQPAPLELPPLVRPWGAIDPAFDRERPSEVAVATGPLRTPFEKLSLGKWGAGIAITGTGGRERPLMPDFTILDVASVQVQMAEGRATSRAEWQLSLSDPASIAPALRLANRGNRVIGQFTGSLTSLSDPTAQRRVVLDFNVPFPLQGSPDPAGAVPTTEALTGFWIFGDNAAEEPPAGPVDRCYAGTFMKLTEADGAITGALIDCPGPCFPPLALTGERTAAGLTLTGTNEGDAKAAKVIFSLNADPLTSHWHGTRDGHPFWAAPVRVLAKSTCGGTTPQYGDMLHPSPTPTPSATTTPLPSPSARP